MHKVAIMTDTNSGYTVREAEVEGIFLLPMPFIIDGEVMYEYEDLTHKRFYELLARGADVSTSMPAPGDTGRLWASILAQGYDEIVYIPMSSGLSSSCHSATLLADDFHGKVQVADNRRISVTLRQSVRNAASYAEQACSAREIKERLENDAHHSSIYITLDTLKYLRKGGRVTPAGAMKCMKPSRPWTYRKTRSR